MLSVHILDRISRTVYAAVGVWDETGDPAAAAPSYEDSDDSVKEAITARINKILTDPRAGDATFHNEWLAKQKAEGWSSGREYDEAKKVDPHCVPFHLLPPDMQGRERLFRAITLSLSRI